MPYQRFEDLPVWKDAIDLACCVFSLSATGCLKPYAGLRDQLERAAVSVSNNIAEGFERGSNAELLAFLYIARGSAGEVRSMTHLLERMRIDHVEPTIHELKSRSESIAKQLGRWMEYLKNSGYQGTKSQNDQSRQRNSQLQRRDAYLQELQRIQEDAKKTIQEDKPGSS